MSKKVKQPAEHKFVIADMPILVAMLDAMVREISQQMTAKGANPWENEARLYRGLAIACEKKAEIAQSVANRSTAA